MDIADGRITAEGGRTGRARVAALLGVLLVLAWYVALFFPVLLGGETFSRGDLVILHRPMRTLLVHLWQASHGLPLWNPYFNFGQPFAANPHAAVFYPLSWLFLVLPWETAFRLQVLIPVAVALAAMVFFLRTLGARREVALFGGCVWAFGGYLLSVTELLPVLFSVAPMPAVLGFAARVLRGGPPRDAAWLALAFGLECAGGEPSVFVVTALLLLAVAADRRQWGPGEVSEGEPAGRTPRSAARRALVVLGGLALGTVISAAVLVPARHLESESARGRGLPATRVGDWSLPPIRLLEPVFPELLGTRGPGDSGTFWGASLYPGHRRPFINSLYFGLLPLALALAAATVRARSCWPWTAAALLGLGLALAGHVPLWNEVWQRLPLLHGLRYPERWVLAAAFAAVVLASRGLEWLLDGDRAVARRVVTVLVAVAALATAAGLGVRLGTAFLGAPTWGRLGVASRFVDAFARLFPRGCVVQGAIALVTLLPLALLRGSRRTPAVALVFLAVAGDLVHAGRPLLATARPQDLDAPPAFLAPLAAGQSRPRLFHLASCEKRCTDLISSSELAVPPMPAQWLIPLAFQPDLDLLELRRSSRATDAVLALAARRADLAMPLLARCGVGAVLDCPLRNSPAAEPARGGVPLHLELLPVPRPRPLVSCVEQVAAVAGVSGWRVAAERLGGAVRDAALVDGRQGARLPERVSPCLVALGPVTPLVLSARVVGRGPAPSFVAVNVTWDEEWRALVDGRASSLLRTDLSLMGLVVPPGEHTLELSYRDPWVTCGVALSLGGLVAWLLVLALTRRGTRRRPKVQSAP